MTVRLVAAMASVKSSVHSATTRVVRRSWCTVSIALAIAMSVLAPSRAEGQLVPDARWLTLETRNFEVHFTPELESLARRAAVVAESAWVRLATELEPPSGRVQLVIADNVDFSNGLATPFPTNRIVVYARPPVDGTSLRFYDDWMSLVVTHELVHIFHLDRARGLWRVGQYVFGRNPALMPNLYLPAWVKEGLAIYYETRLTNSGRLAGSQFPMYARAAASAGRLPGLGDLSLANPSFLGGEVAYAYGALAFDHLARTHGEEGVAEFVEETSRRLIPFRLNAAAERAFGISLDDAWEEWRDSLREDVPHVNAPLPHWRTLTERGWFVAAPRWLDSAHIAYAANTGRETAGVYVADTAGNVRRAGRRNALEPNVPLPDGGLLFAQPDFVGPFTLRSDLWVERDGRERRLTTGARLSRPDVRHSDGAIVAVQAEPGSSRLVRLPADGSRIVPLTSSSPDTQWTEPRWSPDGGRIAAVRWSSGGVTEIVVLDAAGAVQHVLARDRAINSMPAWTPDGRSVVYASDRSGSLQLWSVRLPSWREEPAGTRLPPSTLLSESTTGLSAPAPAPGGEMLAAVHFRADGWHLGIGSLELAGAQQRIAAEGAPEVLPGESVAVRNSRQPVVMSEESRLGTISPDNLAVGEARRYSPWRQLLPRYWAPIAGQGPGGDVSVGALSSGSDVVGRHAWSAQLSVEPSTSLWEGGAGWRYAGFGQPFVDVGGSQSWTRDRIVQEGTLLGELDERVRYGSLGLTFIRPRVRSYGTLSIGADFESRRFVPRTEVLAGLLREDLHGTRNAPGVRLSSSWSNAQYPSLAISPEDGITAALTLRNRWLPDASGSTTRSAVARLAAFKSLPLPGPSHHVIAVRGALGWQDARTTSPFEIGGVSGGSVELLPGLPVGGAQRTFFVRGWAPATLEGTRAAAAAIEWRAPLAIIGSAIGHLPAFVQRASLSAFADAATAWCADADLGTAACRQAPVDAEWLMGAGAELLVDLAPLYDVPYRVRLGVATPVGGADRLEGRSAGVYLTLGSSF